VISAFNFPVAVWAWNAAIGARFGDAGRVEKTRPSRLAARSARRRFDPRRRMQRAFQAHTATGKLNALITPLPQRMPISIIRWPGRSEAIVSRTAGATGGCEAQMSSFLHSPRPSETILPVSIDTSRPRSSRACRSASAEAPHSSPRRGAGTILQRRKACAASSIAAFACRGVTSGTRAVTPPSIGVRRPVAVQRSGVDSEPVEAAHHLAVQHDSRVDIRCDLQVSLDLLRRSLPAGDRDLACARQRQAARWNFAAHGGSGPDRRASPTSIGATSTLLLPT